MAIGFRSATVVGNLTQDDPTLSKPAGFQSDDLLLVYMVSNTGSAQSATGWTFLGANPVNGGGSRFGVLAWAPGDVASTQFTSAGGAFLFAYEMLAFTGVNLTNPVDVSAHTADADADRDMECPSVVATVLGMLVVGGGASNGDASGMGVPAGFTEAADLATAFAFSCCADFMSLAATGATGVTTIQRVTNAGLGNGTNWSVVLNPLPDRVPPSRRALVAVQRAAVY